jgi:hypothetical protein
MMDMNDVRDIILQWERGFDTEEEKMFFYMKHHKTLKEEYWDLLPMGTAIKDHPWDNSENT